MSDMPVMITVAPNGARRGKADHPAIPLTTAEIVAEAVACRSAGAAILHLHVRDGDGQHTLDPGRYAETLAALRDATDLVVQPTTECVGRFGPEQMMAVQRQLVPEMISLNLNELLGARSDAELGAARHFLAEVHAAGTVPQYLLFSREMVEEFRHWWQQGWVPQARPFVLLVLGRYGGAAGSRADLRELLRILPVEWCWGVCAFGAEELPVNVLAALAGGHCRVGFENNLERRAGEPLPDNHTQVAHLAALLGELDRPLATPAHVRQRFGLKPR